MNDELDKQDNDFDEEEGLPPGMHVEGEGDDDEDAESDDEEDEEDDFE